MTSDGGEVAEEDQERRSGGGGRGIGKPFWPKNPATYLHYCKMYSPTIQDGWRKRMVRHVGVNMVRQRTGNEPYMYIGILIMQSYVNGSIAKHKLSIPIFAQPLTSNFVLVVLSLI